MVVIAAIESILPGVQDVTAEQYALALEQMLIHHYKLFEMDRRIVNNTFTSDPLDNNMAAAYVLYIAYNNEPSTAATQSSFKGFGLGSKKSGASPY